MWLIKSAGKLAGFGWTLQGDTIEPHYFPLAQDDVHLFDFHVFPQYRGQGLNPFLVNYILHSLASESSGRAFIGMLQSGIKRNAIFLLARRHFVAWVWLESQRFFIASLYAGRRMNAKRFD